MAIKSIMTELKWFLKGDTNIRYLVQNGCNIWNGDVYKVYKRSYDWDLDEYLSEKEFVDKIKTDEGFAKVWGELGPVYGKQWRDWDVRNDGSYDSSIDQISNLIHELKTNPDGRRLIVSTLECW